MCDECGTLEAIEDMAGGFKLPLSAWAIMKNPVEWEMPLQLTFVGRDSWSRPVYECGGRLYVDVDPRRIAIRPPARSRITTLMESHASQFLLVLRLSSFRIVIPGDPA